MELRIVSRDDAGATLFSELLPLAGLAVAVAGGAAARPVYPGELHLLSDADALTGHEGLPILFIVTPMVRLAL